jgi:hypothetical protein
MSEIETIIEFVNTMRNQRILIITSREAEEDQKDPRIRRLSPKRLQ